MTNAPSAKRVQYILKVGDTTTHYFDRMVEERISLYTAYLECKAKDDNTMPPAPTVKEPVYTSTATSVPSFEIPTISVSHVRPAIEEMDDSSPFRSDVKAPETTTQEESPEMVALPTEHPDAAKFEMCCHHCKQKSVIQILKKDTPWH
jgi:hypothetical protein